MSLVRARKLSRRSVESSSEDEDEIKEVVAVESEVREEQSKFNFSTLLFIMLCAAVIIIMCAVGMHYAGRLESAVPSEKELEDAVRDISRLFPAQKEKLWRNIHAVLSLVSRRDSSCPSVILLINREDKHSKATSECLVSMVANRSVPLLGLKMEPLFLKDADLSCNECVSKMRSKVKAHGIVVIPELESFSEETAKHLHFFCDEHDDAFAKALYVLTMTVNNNLEKATQAAEMALQSSWNKMAKDEQDALIIRLTSLVEFIQPEKTLDCKL